MRLCTLRGNLYFFYVGVGVGNVGGYSLGDNGSGGDDVVIL